FLTKKKNQECKLSDILTTTASEFTVLSEALHRLYYPRLYRDNSNSKKIYPGELQIPYSQAKKAVHKLKSMPQSSLRLFGVRIIQFDTINGSLTIKNVFDDF